MGPHHLPELRPASKTRKKTIMLQFTISSIASVIRPYAVLKIGSHSGEPECCVVNGVDLKLGDWVLATGVIPQESAIKVFREYGREFQGHEPQFFTFMLSSWYEAAKIEPGAPIHWDAWFHWDGLSLAAIEKPRGNSQPSATIEV
jgi:hypothetical protein